jgi:hypothetical protein
VKIQSSYLPTNRYLDVEEAFDAEGDLIIGVYNTNAHTAAWLDRDGVTRLRDHFNVLLGEDTTPASEAAINTLRARLTTSDPRPDLPILPDVADLPMGYVMDVVAYLQERNTSA